MAKTARTRSRARKCDYDSCDESATCTTDARLRTCTRSGSRCRTKSACRPKSCNKRPKSKPKCPKSTRCIQRTRSGKCVQPCTTPGWTSDPVTGKCLKPGTAAYTAMLIAEEKRHDEKLKQLHTTGDDNVDLDWDNEQ